MNSSSLLCLQGFGTFSGVLGFCFCLRAGCKLFLALHSSAGTNSWADGVWSLAAWLWHVVLSSDLGVRLDFSDSFRSTGTREIPIISSRSPVSITALLHSGPGLRGVRQGGEGAGHQFKQGKSASVLDLTVFYLKKQVFQPSFICFCQSQWPPPNPLGMESEAFLLRGNACSEPYLVLSKCRF